MKHFYVYYSYEEWGRGYLGARECDCLPEEDRDYFGSYYDKTFQPTHKMVLAVFEDRKSALEAESQLHKLFEVDINPHFANLSRQTSGKFTYSAAGEIWITDGIREKKVPSGSKVPEGFRLGRILEERQWFTNGTDDLWLPVASEIPKGYSRGRCKMRANNNPQHGTKWITNGRETAKIKDGETVPEGWDLGFIMDKVPRIWINDGKSSKQHPATNPVPCGWTRGRLMPWASSAGKKSKPIKQQ